MFSLHCCQHKLANERSPARHGFKNCFYQNNKSWEANFSTSDEAYGSNVAMLPYSYGIRPTLGCSWRALCVKWYSFVCEILLPLLSVPFLSLLRPWHFYSGTLSQSWMEALWCTLPIPQFCCMETPIIDQKLDFLSSRPTAPSVLFPCEDGIFSLERRRLTSPVNMTAQFINAAYKQLPFISSSLLY